MAGDNEPERPDRAEGGPVKTFLEHLEDFRWVLIKSVVALLLGMLVCLFAANDVVRIIKWPLTHARIHYFGTNQIVAVGFGTNHLGNFPLTPGQQQSLDLGTNRFVAVEIEPLVLGTNRVLGWRVNPDPDAAAGDYAGTVRLVHAGNRRISLGVRQLRPDPWDDIAAKYIPDMVLSGKVTKVANFGLFVEIDKDLEGLAHISEISLAEGEKLEEKFKIGDEVKVKVVKVDSIQHKIALSLKV